MNNLNISPRTDLMFQSQEKGPINRSVLSIIKFGSYVPHFQTIQGIISVQNLLIPITVGRN